MNNFDIEQYVRKKVTPSQLKALTGEQKVEWMKNRFGLTHGGSQQNKSKRKKRRKK